MRLRLRSGLLNGMHFSAGVRLAGRARSGSDRLGASASGRRIVGGVVARQPSLLRCILRALPVRSIVPNDQAGSRTPPAATQLICDPHRRDAAERAREKSGGEGARRMHEDLTACGGWTLRTASHRRSVVIRAAHVIPATAADQLAAAALQPSVAPGTPVPHVFGVSRLSHQVGRRPGARLGTGIAQHEAQPTAAAPEDSSRIEAHLIE